MSFRPVHGSMKVVFLLASLTALTTFATAACRAADEPDAESRAGWQKM